MRNKLSPDAALLRAQALCSRGEHCEADVRAKLSAWGIDYAQINIIIASLISEDFINHSRYATAFARDKYRFNGWGRQKIIQALRAKRIEDNLINNALLEINDNEYDDAMQHALNAKAKQLRGKEPRLARASLIRFAASRGYEPAKFFPLISDILNYNEDDELD